MHNSKPLERPTSDAIETSSNKALPSQKGLQAPSFNEQTNYVPTKVIITVSSSIYRPSQVLTCVDFFGLCER